MARWLTALLLLAAAIAGPAAVRAEARGPIAASAAHEPTACCGGACSCGPACACAADGSDAEPRGNEAPAPIRERDDRTLAMPQRPAAPCGLAESERPAAATMPAAVAVRPAGRALLERISRWTT